MTESATEGEIGQMRSVVGSLAWIARQYRPDLSYEVSAVSRATVQELKWTNEAVKKCQAGSHIGLVFKAKAFKWKKAVLVSIIDASFAQESETDVKGNRKDHRSQIARECPC